MELIVYDVAARTPVEELENRVVVVIDILRTISVMVTALHNGACGIIPVLSIEEAEERAAQFVSGFCLRGGEQGALKIPHFDLGNSPLEYSPEVVRGKTIILTTSNGTRAIRRVQVANHILIGSFLNARAAATRAYQLANEMDSDLVVLCAGMGDRFSLDDYFCAGLICRLIEALDCEHNRLDWLTVRSRRGLYMKTFVMTR
ncbi:MAG: 2-phosphosulfolactate phosphatase [Firmicutes bacterium]|nr:2-phosphosulfolactate phosphatase [Bacillota bacterium]